MGNGLEIIKNSTKKIIKKVTKKIVKLLLPILLLILLVAIIIGGFIKVLTDEDAKYEEGNWKSIPYGASQYTSNVVIDSNGNISTSMSAQEIWDRLVEENSRVTEYLDGPEDLLKLMNAEVITNFPDTRDNPDEAIDWNTLNRDINSKNVQGIIKFKRAKSDGSTQTMSFVDTETFYNWIEQYNSTGDEDIKQKVLTHFTIEQDSGIGSSSNPSLDYNGKDTITDISERIVAAAKSTPSQGTNLCQSWVREVYKNAGLGNVYFASAMEAYHKNVVSTDINNIPVGAAVYGTGSGSVYGHVGIYIGNGLVMDNVNDKVMTSTLEDWIAWQEKKGAGWLGWGWQAGSPTKIISEGKTEDDSSIQENEDDNIKMSLITDNGKVTFYNGDGSAMEGGKFNAIGYELSDGQVAMKNLSKYKNCVIYIETTESGEGSYANGRFFYVTDTGGGLADNQVDVYANVDQQTLNSAPYGSYGNGAKIYLVEENVTFEDYQAKYLDKSLVNVDSTQTQNKYHIKVATWTETEEIVSTTEPGVATTHTYSYSMTTQAINYQDFVKSYTMPFDYLWALVVLGRDKDFPLELTELVYNSKIEITIHDNLTVTTNIDTETYTKQVTVPSGTGTGTTTETRTYTRTHTIITRDNTLKIALTTADVWIVNYSQKFTYQSSGESNKYIEEPAKVIEKTDPRSKEDNFVTIFLKSKHYKSRNSILSAPDWLFDILERNSKTVDFVDLTKYLLYKATGRDYGVTDYDFEGAFTPNDFTDVSGIYGNSIEEKVWFALRGAGYSEIATAAVMGNIANESGFDPQKVEAGSGIGFGLCQWSFGRRDSLEAYIASKGVDNGDVTTQIEFLLGEITPGGGANGYATFQMGSTSSEKYDGRRYTYSDWKDATDLDTSTMAFMAVFERPSYDSSVNHIDRRQSDAKKYYEQFKGKTAPSGDDRIGEIKLSGDNASKMLAMLTEAIRIADDNSYTYSQSNRFGEYQYDCSSFVYRLFQEYFGINIPSSTGSYSKSSSYYMGAEGSVELQPGDVLWRSGHVEIYLGNGLMVGAHSANVPIADQISVTSHSSGAFTDVYRFVE